MRIHSTVRLQTRSFDPERSLLTGDETALDSPRTLILAFGASDVQARRFRELRAGMPHSHIVGCSTAGEIFGTEVNDGSVVLAIARFEHSRVRTTSTIVHGSDDSLAAGSQLGAALIEQDLRAVLVLSDGLRVNGSDLVRGIRQAVGDRAVITGGLAADGARFSKTWVLHQDCAQSGMVAAVGLYGARLKIGHGSKGGWDIFGPERRITRSRGNVLYELDGRPALELYKTYLGERAAGLPATALLFPLEVRASESPNRGLVRTVLAVDEGTQSMTFAGDMPEGALAQLMRANFDRLVQGASDAASMARLDTDADADADDAAPVLSIAISCVGRRLVLGERTEEETEATLDVLPRGAKQIGFYSYGEISPYSGGSCELHNQTMTLTTIAEQ